MFGHLGPKCLLDNSVKDTLVLEAEMSALAYGRFPPDVSQTRWTFPVHILSGNRLSGKELLL